MEDGTGLIVTTQHPNLNGTAASRKPDGKEKTRTDAQLTFRSMSIGPQFSTPQAGLSAAAQEPSEQLRLIFLVATARIVRVGMASTVVAITATLG